MERFNRHFTIWTKQYGLGCLASMIPLVAAFPLAFFVKQWLGPGVGPLLALVAGAIATGTVCTLQYQRNKRMVSIEELENLAPALDLDPVGRAYTDTVIALGKSNLSEDVVKETLASLNRVLDESERLTEAAGPEPEEDLPAQDERARLVGLRDGTSDPDARAMYDESLRLLDSRSSGRADAAARRVRADAQRELMRQTVLAVRDAIVGGREVAGAVPEGDVRKLLERVADVRREADAGARAAAELRAL